MISQPQAFDTSLWISTSIPKHMCEPRSWCHPRLKHSHQGLVCRGSGEVWGWSLCLCSGAAYTLHPADICPWVLLLGHLLPGISSVSGCFNAKLWVCLQKWGRPVAVQVRNRQDFLDLSLQHAKPVGDASWVSFAPSLFAPALLWANTSWTQNHASAFDFAFDTDIFPHEIPRRSCLYSRWGAV